MKVKEFTRGKKKSICLQNVYLHLEIYIIKNYSRNAQKKKKSRQSEDQEQSIHIKMKKKINKIFKKIAYTINFNLAHRALDFWWLGFFILLALRHDDDDEFKLNTN